MNLESLSKDFTRDLISLINSLKGIKKTEEVQYKQTKFKFIPLDKILDKVKENENFAFLQPLGTDQNGVPGIQCILIHKTGQMLVSDYYPIRLKQNDTLQGDGSAITYTKRYAASAFLGIASETDTDGNPPEQQNDDAIKKANSEQKEIKKLLNQQIGIKGSNNAVYASLGLTKESFIIDYETKPKELLQQMKLCFQQ